MNNTQAYCNHCGRLVSYRIKEQKNGRLVAYCMNCGKQVYVAEVAKHNAELAKKDK